MQIDLPGSIVNPTMDRVNHTDDAVVAPFIDGLLQESESKEAVEVIDPSTGERRLTIPAGCDADAARAVSSARLTFDKGIWNDVAPSSKKEVLHRLADLIADEAAAFDAFDAGEMGKPVSLRF